MEKVPLIPTEEFPKFWPPMLAVDWIVTHLHHDQSVSVRKQTVLMLSQIYMGQQAESSNGQLEDHEILVDIKKFQILDSLANCLEGTDMKLREKTGFCLVNMLTSSIHGFDVNVATNPRILIAIWRLFEGARPNDLVKNFLG
jgi:hypothetical protein